ncbi:MAG: hypothetical protein J4400_00655 [Candidatus Aenigmarchaeota archaeon]|nr:hypothetical protein [Candidatus Aenigmarchaeota archaeon]
MNIQSELTRLSIELYTSNGDPYRTASRISSLLNHSKDMPDCDREYYWDIVRARLPYFQLVSDN